MIKDYLKQMKKRHEAFKNYGLDFDYDLWAELNHENLVREVAEGITIQELSDMADFFDVNGLENYVEDGSKMWRYQRLIAEFRVRKMIKSGLINRLTYLPI